MLRPLLVLGAIIFAASGALYFGSLGDHPYPVSNTAAKSDFGVFPVKPAGTAELDPAAEAAAIRAFPKADGTTG